MVTPLVPFRAVSVTNFAGLFNEPTMGCAFPHGCITLLFELSSGSMTCSAPQPTPWRINYRHRLPIAAP